MADIFLVGGLRDPDLAHRNSQGLGKSNKEKSPQGWHPHGQLTVYHAFSIRREQEEVKMFEKMTDGDVMIYLRNDMLALLQLAQERKIPIDMNTGLNGYVRARAGDYTVTQYSEGHIEYAYEPISETESRYKEWKNYIPPQSIRFGQAPKEEKHGE